MAETMDNATRFGRTLFERRGAYSEQLVGSFDIGVRTYFVARHEVPEGTGDAFERMLGYKRNKTVPTENEKLGAYQDGIDSCVVIDKIWPLGIEFGAAEDVYFGIVAAV